MALPTVNIIHKQQTRENEKSGAAPTGAPSAQLLLHVMAALKYCHAQHKARETWKMGEINNLLLK